MSLYTAGIEAKKAEMDMLQKSLDRLDAIQAKKDAAEARKQEMDAAKTYQELKDKEDTRRWEAEYALKKAEATGTKLSEAALKDKAAVEQAQKIVDEIDRLSQKGSKGALGIVAEPLSKAKGVNAFKDTAKLNAARTRYAMQIQQLTGVGSAGTMGVKLLNELKDVLPSAYDDEDNRQMKIDILRQAVADKAETMYTVHGITPSFNPYAYKGVIPPGGGMSIPGPTQTAKQSPLGPEWVPVP